MGVGVGVRVGVGVTSGVEEGVGVGVGVGVGIGVGVGVGVGMGVGVTSGVGVAEGVGAPSTDSTSSLLAGSGLASGIVEGVVVLVPSGVEEAVSVVTGDGAGDSEPAGEERAAGSNPRESAAVSTIHQLNLMIWLEVALVQTRKPWGRSTEPTYSAWACSSQIVSGTACSPLAVTNINVVVLTWLFII